MPRLGRSAVVVVSVLALLALGACSRSSSKSSSSNTSTSAGGGSSAAAGDFGSLKGVCGPGNAKGSTAQGVSDSTIRVGTMADPGAQAQPGLDQELFDTADAFVGWCNAAGGIDGRKLQLDKWDSKLTEVAARMIQACQSDFMLVGNGEALDATGVDQRTKCKLAEMPAYVVSAQAGTAPMSLQAIPTSNHQSDLGGAYRALKAFDAAVTQHYGLISSQFQSIKDSGDRARQAAKQLGYTETYYDEAPLLVDNWRPYAQNVQTKGVQVLSMEGAPGTLANLAKALSDLGTHPKYFIGSANYYDQTLIQNAGSALTGDWVYVNDYIVPFEMASQNPPTKQYIDILAQYANGAKPKSLGVNAMSAWLLWAKGVKECGSNLTSDCVLSKASAVTDWDGGGLTAPIKPGNANSPTEGCFVLLKASPTGFTIDSQITKPNTGIFNCGSDNQINLTGFPK
ncbi:MAG TPA: ABC transporter substrate-binding protein [Acidimicrobiia bacterium]|nr:ABC transporter substrate-binding protein [Acidimicrobiia bacterium]